MASPFAVVPHRFFERGEVIFRQGDDGQGECYLVDEGKIEVRRTVEDEERVLRILGQGDLLGEVALFRNAPHSASAVAVEPSTLLVISEDRLELMVRSHPGLAIALI